MINTKGEYILKTVYDDIWQFTKENVFIQCRAISNLYRLSLYNDKFDKDRQFIWAFHPSVIVVKLNGKCGLTDNLGNEILKPAYDFIWDYSQKLLIVRNGKKWGFIDSSGKTIVQPIYDQAGDFNELIKIDSRMQNDYLDL